MLKRISAFLSARGNVVPAPAEIAQGFFDEMQAEQKGSYVANPQVVHGKVSGEGKGFFQYVAFEGHAAPDVAILYQQVVELTEMCLVTLEKDGFVTWSVGSVIAQSLTTQSASVSAWLIFSILWGNQQSSWSER